MVETKSGPAGRAEGSVTSHVYGGDGTAKDGALATDSGVAAARPRQAYTVVSLFSGCGGMDLGFEQAGFRIEVASDHCRAAADTYRSNSAGTEFVEDDITDPATKQAIVAACGGRCDVVIGGPPCGPYSRSGERDPNDPRARLFEDYLDLVGRLRPKVAVMENVVPLLSARNPAGGLVYDEIVEGFKRLGYVVDSKALCAADYGVPQRRARLIIIATRLGVTIRFPEPTHAEDGETSGRLPWRTMRNAIGDLEDAAEDEQWSHVFTRHTSEVAARYAATPIGGKGCVNYNEGFYRNPPDQPSITLKTAAWPLH
jgi:DNA-cytosine methyltransferase